MAAKVNSKFWENKRVFITGNTGFKGCWLSHWLFEMGATIKGYSLKSNSDISMFNLTTNVKEFETDINNILDFEKLKKSMVEFNPDIIFHLAAQPLVQLSYQKPRETYLTNVIGTVNVLDSARFCPNLKSIINVTSDKCYENNEWEWGYRENDKLGGHDPYSNSKACSELVTSAFRSSFFSNIDSPSLASVRAGNVIGGGDWSEDRLLPDLIRCIAYNSKFIMRNPKASRPWQHVLDCLAGYLILAENLFSNNKFSGSWNFGPNETDVCTVEWIVDYVKNNSKYPISIEPNSNKTPHESQHLTLDSSKARTKLGWNPNWNIEQSINKSMDWYEAYLNSGNLKIKTLNQIKEYQSH